MGRKQVENTEDLRKSVRNSKNKKSKGVWKKIILILFVCILIVAATLTVVTLLKNKRVSLQEVTEYNYFITSINGKSGVIDRKGNKIIDEQYQYIQIPNPQKPVFVCYEEDNTSKVLN